MKQVTTKMEKVEEIIYKCDICNRLMKHHDFCAICGKDMCLKHCHDLDLSFLARRGIGCSYECCSDCNKQLECWRREIKSIESEYETKVSTLKYAFNKAFPEKED